MKKITLLTLACLLAMFYAQIKGAKAQNKKIEKTVKEDKSKSKKEDNVEKKIIVESKNGKTTTTTTTTTNGKTTTDVVVTNDNDKQSASDKKTKTITKTIVINDDDKSSSKAEAKTIIINSDDRGKGGKNIKKTIIMNDKGEVLSEDISEISDDDEIVMKNGKEKKVILINEGGKSGKENVNISINGKAISIDESSEELEKSMERMLSEMSAIADKFGCEMSDNFNYNFSMNDDEIVMSINGKEERIKLSGDDKDETIIIKKKVIKNGDSKNEDGSEAERIIKVFPNPSSGRVSVKFNFEKSQDATVVVMDSTGKEQFLESFKNVKNETKELDLTKLSKGNYSVMVKTKEQCINQTLILE